MRKLLALFRKPKAEVACTECQECLRLQRELRDMTLKFQTAAGAQRAQHRRLMTLKADMPQIHDAYFTRAGEILRVANQ